MNRHHLYNGVLFHLFWCCLLLAFPRFSEAQFNQHVWHFGDSAGIDFRDPGLGALPFHSATRTKGSNADINTDLGEQLFYVGDHPFTGVYSTLIFDSNDIVMPGCDSVYGPGAYNGIVIVPRPGWNDRFYVFSYISFFSLIGLYCTEVDMTLRGGLGDVVDQNRQLGQEEYADCLTAIRHGNGRDWWVIGKMSSQSSGQTNRFYVLEVTPSGISPPDTQDMGLASDLDIQRIVWHPDGNHFLLINARGFMCEYDFDRCSGQISQRRLIFPEQTSGYNRIFNEGAFSPNGELLYVSTVAFGSTMDHGYLLQFNLSAPDVPGSCDTLDVFYPPIGTGAVRRGPDGRVYFTRAYECPGVYCYPYPDSVRNYVNQNLSVIHQPDLDGPACDYRPFSFYLGGKRTYYGLPNNADYSLGPLAGSPCDTLTNGLQQDALSASYLEVFPNPAPRGRCLLRSSAPFGRGTILQVLDASGNLLLNTELPPATAYPLDLSAFSPGLYLLRLSDGRRVRVVVG